MNCVSSHRLSIAGLMGLLAFTPPATARAGTKVLELEPPADSVEEPRQYNSVIDCSTNVAYRVETYREYVSIVGFKGCASCHRGASPVVGRGDRPRAHYASFSIFNKHERTIKYELRVGEGGTWKEYEIASRKSHVISWRYQRAHENRSPKYYVRHNNQEYQLQPLATPNQLIGNLYYFNSSGGRTARLWSPRHAPYRRR